VTNVRSATVATGVTALEFAKRRDALLMSGSRSGIYVVRLGGMDVMRSTKRAPGFALDQFRETVESWS